jgi:hypothetical protein
MWSANGRSFPSTLTVDQSGTSTDSIAFANITVTTASVSNLIRTNIWTVQFWEADLVQQSNLVLNTSPSNARERYYYSLLAKGKYGRSFPSQLPAGIPGADYKFDISAMDNFAQNALVSPINPNIVIAGQNNLRYSLASIVYNTTGSTNVVGSFNIVMSATPTNVAVGMSVQSGESTPFAFGSNATTVISKSGTTIGISLPLTRTIPTDTTLYFVSIPTGTTSLIFTSSGSTTITFNKPAGFPSLPATGEYMLLTDSTGKQALAPITNSTAPTVGAFTVTSGQALYTTSTAGGTYVPANNAYTFSWQAPPNVYRVSVVAIGGGGGGGSANSTNGYSSTGGGGGALAYTNNISVTPGQYYTVQVGAGGTGVTAPTTDENGTAGGNSYFKDTSTVLARGGAGGYYNYLNITVPIGQVVLVGDGTVSGTTSTLSNITSTAASAIGSPGYVSATWTCPANVYNVSILCVGAGGGGGGAYGGGGGGGGGLSYLNNYAVTPGQTYTIQAGKSGPGGLGALTSAAYGWNGGHSYFRDMFTVGAYGGSGGGYHTGGTTTFSGGTGGSPSAGTSGYYGGSGGNFQGNGSQYGSGGGGAAGYSGNGGNGGDSGAYAGPGNGSNAAVGSGGGGGGGAAYDPGNSGGGAGAGGGGVGILGLGSDGSGGSGADVSPAISSPQGGTGGSGGSNGGNGTPSGSNYYGGYAGTYGGGGGGSANGTPFFGADGGQGVVRIIWPASKLLDSSIYRSFPNTLTIDQFGTLIDKQILNVTGSTGGTYTGTSGGNGGASGGYIIASSGGQFASGGGGAGGYGAVGGYGGDALGNGGVSLNGSSGASGTSGSGGGGGASRYGTVSSTGGAGGGTSIYGLGTNGSAGSAATAGAAPTSGGGGSGGIAGGGGGTTFSSVVSVGGAYGGGGGGVIKSAAGSIGAGAGASGAVRIIWPSNKLLDNSVVRAFPSTNVIDQSTTISDNTGATQTYIITVPRSYVSNLSTSGNWTVQMYEANTIKQSNVVTNIAPTNSRERYYYSLLAKGKYGQRIPYEIPTSLANIYSADNVNKFVLPGDKFISVDPRKITDKLSIFDSQYWYDKTNRFDAIVGQASPNYPSQQYTPTSISRSGSDTVINYTLSDSSLSPKVGDYVLITDNITGFQSVAPLSAVNAIAVPLGQAVFTNGSTANNTATGVRYIGISNPDANNKTSQEYIWTCPNGVTSVSVLAVGAGGGGTSAPLAGAGGALVWAKNIAVTPGTTYSVFAAGGGIDAYVSAASRFITPTVNVIAGSGAQGTTVGTWSVTGITGVQGTDYGGGNGGAGGLAQGYNLVGAGGGGAGGYNGNGGTGANPFPGYRVATAAATGSGGGGGGGANTSNADGDSGGGGGGVGILGIGTTGYAGSGGVGYGTPSSGGGGGSGGFNGNNEGGAIYSGPGGFYGGGGAGNNLGDGGAGGGDGVVRLIWPAVKASDRTTVRSYGATTGTTILATDQSGFITEITLTISTSYLDNLNINNTWSVQAWDPEVIPQSLVKTQIAPINARENLYYATIFSNKYGTSNNSFDTSITDARAIVYDRETGGIVLKFRTADLGQGVVDVTYKPVAPIQFWN